MRGGFSKSTPVFSKRLIIPLSSPNRITKSLFSSQSDRPLLSLLEKCQDTRHLRQIHAQIITLGLVRYAYITSRVLAFYAVPKKGNLDYAGRIFDGIQSPTIYDWNTMIMAYSRSFEPELGLMIFGRMRADGIQPNTRTYPFVIKSCVDFNSLSQVHGQVMKFGFNFDVYVISSLIKVYSQHAIELALSVFDETPNRNIASWTSLISGYCAQGLVVEARKLFDEMPERNAVSWSAMISGFVQNKFYAEAIELFSTLKERADLRPSWAVLVSVLNACAGLGASEEGRWVHSYIDKNGFDYRLELGTALVDFYLKCGDIESAHRVFTKIPSKDVTAWSAMIMGLAINGCSNSALALFAEMDSSRTEPNDVTFIGILSACSHGGLVDEGWGYFKLMTDVYGISPSVEHYGCMVDLLGRAGRLVDAERLIQSMPMEPDDAIWAALLNGCLIHGDFSLGERVGRHLVKLEPQHSGRYILLANLYANLGRWGDVVRTRKMMRERRVTTIPGCSLIEINGVVHRFFVDDKSHSQSEDVCRILIELNSQLTSSSYDTINI